MNLMTYLFHKKRLEDVYTPTTAAKLAYVDRGIIEDKLRKNLLIPGKQIVIYGHSGGGKTTLLNKVLNELEKNYISIGCISGSTVVDIVLEAFDKLNPFYTDSTGRKVSTTITGELKQEYLTIKSSMSSSITSELEETKKRVLPVQLTPNRLIDYLGYAGCILVIEDFHKVERSEKMKLSQLMKLFMDASNNYKEVRIIAIGAVATAREVVAYDAELANRVYELEVPLLSNTELNNVIENGQRLLNVKFEKDLKDGIVKYSNQLGAICHQLCFNICYDNELFKTRWTKLELETEELNNAIEIYLSEKSDSYKAQLDKVLKQKKGKFRNVELIFSALIRLDKTEYDYSEVLEKVQQYTTDYPQGNLSTYFQKLVSIEYDEVLRYDNNSNKYSFSDPFFKAYVIMVFKNRILKESGSPNINDLITINLGKALLKLSERIKVLDFEVEEPSDL